MTEPNASGIPAASQSQLVSPQTARTQLNAAGGKTVGAQYFTQAQTQNNQTGFIAGSVSIYPGGASQFVSFPTGDVTVPDANVTSTFTALGMQLS